MVIQITQWNCKQMDTYMHDHTVADWPTGKPGNFHVRHLGFAAWRPLKDNRQNTKKVH